MHELRFVGPGDDSDHVRVESTDGLDQFALRVDDALREAMKPAPSRPAVDLTVTTVSPREIQVRVRAGEEPADIAAEAGIDISRVLVFARAVLSERSRITDEARRARARRSTPDGQLVVFGESVDERFAAHGLDPLTVGWDSYRRDDGQWLVTASWRGGDSDRSAQWAFTLASRTVTPLDETAADLLSDRPIRPIVRAVPDLPEFAEGDTGPLPIIDAPRRREELYDQDAVERSIADGTADAGTGRAYEPAPTPTAFTPVPLSSAPAFPAGATPVSSAPVSSAPVPSAPVSSAPVPSAPRSFEHRTQSRSNGRSSAVPKLTMNAVPSRDGGPVRAARELTREIGRNPAAVPDTDQPEPVHEQQIELFAEPLPLRLADALTDTDTARLPVEPTGQSLHTDESEDSKAARARIPSWDDILLGVRRKRD